MSRWAGVNDLVMELLGEGELLLVDLDGLLEVGQLDQHLAHVGQGAELGLAVLYQVGDRWGGGEEGRRVGAQVLEEERRRDEEGVECWSDMANSGRRFNCCS